MLFRLGTCGEAVAADAARLLGIVKHGANKRRVVTQNSDGSNMANVIRNYADMTRTAECLVGPTSLGLCDYYVRSALGGEMRACHSFEAARCQNACAQTVSCSVPGV